MADRAGAVTATPAAPHPARRPRWRLPAPVLATLAAAATLAGAWLAAPPLGTDLSAQVARADFFAAHGFAPIDFRWYGGVEPLGYSLVTPPLLAWFGPRPVGAAAVVVSALALVALFLRTHAPRPLLGGVLGAVACTGNLVSGRVTFAVGVALGLLALLALVPPAPKRGPRFSPERLAGSPPQQQQRRQRYRRYRRAGRYVSAGVLAALASAASPVAGLFAGLAGTALLLREVGDIRGRERSTSGRSPALPRGWVALVVGAAVPMAVTAGLFGTGGWMNMSRADLTHAAVASLAVAVLVPRRAVRIGALLSAAGVVAAYLVHTPVGLNSTRLATLFTLPLVAAYAGVPERLRRWVERRPGRRVWRVGLRPAVWLLPVLALLAWWQPPVLAEDLASGDDPAAAPAYFAPLERELARRAPAGRVEVVPTAHYWESAYLDAAPLARGWLRQADLRYHPLFFDGTLDAGSYRRWLARNGVSHVALATSPLSWIGRGEAKLIRGGLPYLTAVWRSPDWTLYEVAGSPSIVEEPGALVGSAADAVRVEVDRAGEVLVRVRWSWWLAVRGPAGACVAPAGEWTALRVDAPGEYALTGSLTGAGPRC